MMLHHHSPEASTMRNTPTMTPRLRKGVSLTEVLVAMFVMAIGMISLMTLFPVGAMQIGQALRDDRVTQTARQADGYVRQWWRHSVVSDQYNVESSFWTLDDPNMENKSSVQVSGPVQYTIYRNALYQLPTPTPVAPIINPTFPTRYSPYMLTDSFAYTGMPVSYLPANTAPAIHTLPGPGFNTPSYPVFIDPIGFVNRRGALNLGEQPWVARYSHGATTLANYPGLLLPRRSFTIVTTSLSQDNSALAVASMSDDMTFGMHGAPQGGTVLGRQGRYSWAAVIQRPRNDQPHIANLTILVYDQRPLLPQPQDEYVTAPDLDSPVGSRRVTVTVPNRGELQPLLVRRGGWMIDGTIDPVVYPNFNSGRRQFIPYRISGVTEVSTNSTPSPMAPKGTTTYELDLETPLTSALVQTITAATPHRSQIYFLGGLVEVFQRPPLQPDFGQ
jgi:Prokaryotic N-terminal methylation motif